MPRSRILVPQTARPTLRVPFVNANDHHSLGDDPATQRLLKIEKI